MAALETSTLSLSGAWWHFRFPVLFRDRALLRTTQCTSLPHPATCLALRRISCPLRPLSAFCRCSPTISGCVLTVCSQQQERTEPVGRFCPPEMGRMVQQGQAYPQSSTASRVDGGVWGGSPRLPWDRCLLPEEWEHPLPKGGCPPNPNVEEAGCDSRLRQSRQNMSALRFGGFLLSWWWCAGGESSRCPWEGLAADVHHSTLRWYTTEQPVQFVSHFERKRCWFTFLVLTSTQSWVILRWWHGGNPREQNGATQLQSWLSHVPF